MYAESTQSHRGSEGRHEDSPDLDPGRSFWASPGEEKAREGKIAIAQTVALPPAL